MLSFVSLKSLTSRVMILFSPSFGLSALKSHLVNSACNKGFSIRVLGTSNVLQPRTFRFAAPDITEKTDCYACFLIRLKESSKILLFAGARNIVSKISIVFDNGKLLEIKGGEKSEADFPPRYA